MSERPDLAGDSSLAGIIALLGFVLVATAQVTNMILARGLAGSVPPFTLAFFRWTIIAAGLAPFAIAELGSGRLPLKSSALHIVAAGFLGMFLCGGRSEIRTHGTLAGTPVFKTGALNHSATLPDQEFQSLS